MKKIGLFDKFPNRKYVKKSSIFKNNCLAIVLVPFIKKNKNYYLIL